jgi:hypothetical protein
VIRFGRFAFPTTLRFSDKPSGLKFPQCSRMFAPPGSWEALRVLPTA